MGASVMPSVGPVYTTGVVHQNSSAVISSVPVASDALVTMKTTVYVGKIPANLDDPTMRSILAVSRTLCIRAQAPNERFPNFFVEMRSCA
jgi:hypothetical protein